MNKSAGGKTSLIILMICEYMQFLQVQMLYSDIKKSNTSANVIGINIFIAYFELHSTNEEKSFWRLQTLE